MKVTPERVVRNKLSTFLLKQFIYSKITMTTSDLYSVKLLMPKLLIQGYVAPRIFLVFFVMFLFCLSPFCFLCPMLSVSRDCPFLIGQKSKVAS